MKRVKDPVHGYLSIEDEFFDRIIDTAEFQRLRDLKQLSATYMVYPSANHTRFEHSLGVFSLAKRAFANLRRDDEFCNGVDVDEIERTLLCAALLHDIGHPPFSHIAEKLLDGERLKERLRDLGLEGRMDDADIGSVLTSNHPLDEKAEHELLSSVIILDKFDDRLDALDVDPHEVAAYVLGYSIKANENQGWQHGVAADILSSPMDVDRLDYVSRDNFMTGADVANLDVDRLVSSYTTCQTDDDEYELTFTDKALSTVSNYLEGRLAVYMWVTQHHKSVYANALLRELLEKLDSWSDSSPFTVERIVDDRVGDSFVRARLREAHEADPTSRLSELYRRFSKRDFPSSCWKHRLGYQDKISEDARDEFEKTMTDNKSELAGQIAEHLGLDPESVWLEESYVPNYKPSDLRDVQVAYEGRDVQSVGEIGLYSDDDYTGEMPYIFAPEAEVENIVELLNEELG